MINGKLSKILLVGIMFFVPLEMLTISNLGPGDAFAIGLIITTWVVVWRQRKPVHFPLLFGFWVILIGSLLATVSTVDMFSANISTIQDIYLFVLFLTILNTITDRKGLEWMMKVWVIIAVVEAFIILLDFKGIHIPIIGGHLAKATTIGGSTSAAEDIGRAVGTFRNANAAGGYMMLTTMVMLAVPVTRNFLIKVCVVGLFVISIVATGSIGAQLGVIAGIGVAMLAWLKQHAKASKFWIGLGLVGAFVGGVMAPIILPLVSGGGSLFISGGSINRKLDKRLVLWNRVDWLMENRWLGIGPNVTATVAVIGAHSDYVGFFSERGEIGITGLFILYGEFAVMTLLFDREARSRLEKLAPGPLLGGLLALMIMGTVHETFHGRPVWFMFAVGFALYGFLRRSLSPPPPVVERASVAVTPRVSPGGFAAD